MRVQFYSQTLPAVLPQNIVSGPALYLCCLDKLWLYLHAILNATLIAAEITQHFCLNMSNIPNVSEI